MAERELPIDDAAIDSLAVAPGDPALKQGSVAKGDAGDDADIAARLHDNPEDPDAKLDRGLDESMDASDVPALTVPGAGTEPAPSSGYDEDAEANHRSD
ncbi:hypothetical protein [Sphingomonas sp. 37zxx]|uniref:hypothetical protein n=1 Tax=Sphingomonas sp. 37zxx TaxID=1550073 RepID=UPI00053BEC1B|nr:hypothetical protein [Sphingomonas sp. 37zxx]